MVKLIGVIILVIILAVALALLTHLFDTFLEVAEVLQPEEAESELHLDSAVAVIVLFLVFLMIVLEVKR